MPDLTEIRIGVLFGGSSPERPGSVASAEAAFKSLSAQGARAELLDIDGIAWDGLRGRIDVALLASHGLGGEDGKVQGALDTLGIPYTGWGVMASALGMHKPTFKKMLRAEHIDTPRWVEVSPSWSVATTVSTIHYTLGGPCFLKPASGGGSLEAGIARDDGQLYAFLDKRHERRYEAFIAEELITPATPCTVGVLEVAGELTTLPVHDVETDREFYDYEAKHDLSLRREHCPSVLPEQQTAHMQQVAKRVHQLVGAHGLSRVDFMAAPSGRAAVLEINTVPGLSPHGNLATMARAAGISYDELMRHVVATAFPKPVYVP
ncbi:MAG: D-alanine--D-alanine ligase [Streptomyces sp.]|nr:D-alanine--D-alanine ligase [Streptomyces sp.]